MLARFLSQEAAKLRASLDEEELKCSYEEQETDNEAVATGSASTGYLGSVGPFGVQSPEVEAKLFQEIGEGGFESDDFELLQQLGRISVQQESSSGTREPRAAVIAYAARYHARLAFSRPITTLLKEYLPVARPVACNELLLLKHLCGLPEEKYTSMEAPLSRNPPVVPLLGYFQSAPTDEAVSLSLDDTQDSIWLVYKWEGLRPLNMLLDAGPPAYAASLFKKQEVAEKEAWEQRCALLRAVASGLLSAVDFCHSADVVHGSLSSGSVLLGPWEDFSADAGGITVKLDGFGFGKWFTHKGGQSEAVQGPLAGYGPVSDDMTLEAGKRQDLQAAALVLAETFACCLAPGSGQAGGDPRGALDRVALQRLLFDVFHDDIQQFRDYCLQEPAQFERLVDFLDEEGGAGWQFLAQTLQGRRSALELAQHPFLLAGGPSGKQKGKAGGKGGLPWGR